MKRFAKVVAVAILISGALAAQDIAGRWVGVADTTDKGGTKRQEKQTLDIRNEDGKLTGMLVNKSGNGGIAFQVQQDGAKFNLYGFLPLDGGEHLRWKFEFKNGSLAGTFSAMHDNPRKWVYDRIGAMIVTRADAAGAGSPTKQ